MATLGWKDHIREEIYYSFSQVRYYKTIFDESARTTFIDQIVNKEIDKILDLIVVGFAVPYIKGLSFDVISQETYTQWGKIGKKPESFNLTKKCALFQRIQTCLKQRLNHLVREIMVPVIKKKLSYIHSEELQTMSVQTRRNEFSNFNDVNFKQSLNDYIRWEHLEIDPDSFYAAVQLEMSTFIEKIYEIAKLHEVIHDP